LVTLKDFLRSRKRSSRSSDCGPLAFPFSTCADDALERLRFLHALLEGVREDTDHANVTSVVREIVDQSRKTRSIKASLSSRGTAASVVNSPFLSEPCPAILHVMAYRFCIRFHFRASLRRSVSRLGSGGTGRKTM